MERVGKCSKWETDFRERKNINLDLKVNGGKTASERWHQDQIGGFACQRES